MAQPVPAALWAELRAQGLIDPAAPVPGGAGRAGGAGGGAA
jgi:hypothetical protein